MMVLSDKKGVQQMVMALARLGLKEVVLCPGSRNAPLVISFNRHQQFSCTSIRDERSAAFFAMGKSLERNEPVAVVCTSGSAVLNLAPAIVEAYYQRIPLIVITADRPVEWIDQGDGQTMNQQHIYSNYVRKSYHLNGDASAVNDLWYNIRCICEGFNIATNKDRGPVHFNVSLSEPLYGTAESSFNSVNIFKEEKSEQRLAQSHLERLAREANASQKIMLLAGQHLPGNTLSHVLAEWCQLNQVVVLTESTSNMHHADFIAHIDRCITGLDASSSKELMPDLLITCGGAVVSKRIKTLLRKFKPGAHWNIHPYDATMDTYQALTESFSMQPADFLQQLLPYIKSGISDYKKRWQALNTEKELRHQQYYEQASFSDFKAFGIVLTQIPADTHLHLANSSPVRYAQLFSYRHIASTWCNRGTSGIDGCSSTAMGVAASAEEKKFLLITGDVSFYYDSNALWNESNVGNLKIIIINNSGGGIFRIIEGPDRIEERAAYLETVMNSNAKYLARQYGWYYHEAHDEKELQRALKDFFDEEHKKNILEIFTNPETNPEVLKSYWEFLNKK